MPISTNAIISRNAKEVLGKFKIFLLTWTDDHGFSHRQVTGRRSMTSTVSNCNALFLTIKKRL